MIKKFGMLLALLLTAVPLAAQTPTPGSAIRPGGTSNYDVVLRVPNLKVDSIGLSVDSLRAQLALNARAASLLRLNAGATVGIDSVTLGIRGVRAEAYLFIDLDNVTRIVNRALTSIDKNPQILTGLFGTVDSLVNGIRPKR